MASFPTTPKTFATRSAGQKIASAHVNDLQDEVNAIEDGYLNGTARLNSSRSTVAALSVVGGSTFAGAATFSSGVTVSSGGLTVSTGALTIQQGQIVFPATQVASADANTLDDYEEGSFTPALSGSGGGSVGGYAVQTGHYTKFGNLVICQGQVGLSNKGTISGNLSVTGLPFTIFNNSNIYALSALYWDGLASTWVNMMLRGSGNGTSAQIIGATAAAANTATNVTDAALNNSSAFLFTIAYRTSA